MSDALDTTPKTWSVGEIVTAAQLNSELRDKILAIAARLDDTGWVDAATAGFAPVTNFSNLRGLVRKKNGVVSVALTVTSTNAIADGNVTNVSAVSVPSGWGTSGGNGGVIGGGPIGAAWQGYVNTSYIVIGATSGGIGAGSDFSIQGTWLSD